jgi:glycosyltransferase involved in cell wall biosynthesis
MDLFIFSVVIPLYNNRDYIYRAVDSVLSQTLSPLEIIVIDDGSTDRGAEILSGVDDERLRIIKQENRGVGKARNAGVEQASGDWIAFLDADDAWLPHHLEELSKLVEQFSSAGLLGTAYIELETGRQPVKKAGSEKVACLRKVDYFKEASRNLGFIFTSAVAVRKSVFNEIGGFGSSRTGQDTEFWARIALDCPVAVSSRVTSVYYRGTGGVIESLKKGRADKAIDSLHDVAPVLAMLCERSDDNPELFDSANIRAFVNNRLTVGIKGTLYNANYARAKKLGSLMVTPVDTRAFLWRLASVLPESLMKSVVVSYKHVKRYF